MAISSAFKTHLHFKLTVITISFAYFKEIIFTEVTYMLSQNDYAKISQTEKFNELHFIK